MSFTCTSFNGFLRENLLEKFLSVKNMMEGETNL